MQESFNNHAYGRFKDSFALAEALSRRVDGPAGNDLQQICAALGRVTDRLSLDWGGVCSSAADANLQHQRIKSVCENLQRAMAATVELIHHNLQVGQEKPQITAAQSYSSDGSPPKRLKVESMRRQSDHGEMSGLEAQETSARLSVAATLPNPNIINGHPIKRPTSTVVAVYRQEVCFLCENYTREWREVPEEGKEREEFLDLLLLLNDKQRATVEILSRNKDKAFCCFFHVCIPLVPFDDKENRSTIKAPDAVDENEDLTENRAMIKQQPPSDDLHVIHPVHKKNRSMSPLAGNYFVSRPALKEDRSTAKSSSITRKNRPHKSTKEDNDDLARLGLSITGEEAAAMSIVDFRVLISGLSEQDSIKAHDIRHRTKGKLNTRRHKDRMNNTLLSMHKVNTTAEAAETETT